MNKTSRPKHFNHLSAVEVQATLTRQFRRAGSRWEGPLTQKDAAAFLTGLHSLLGAKEILNLFDPIQAKAVSHLRHWLTRAPDLPGNADVSLSLGGVRQHEHLVTEDQLRLILTPGGITLNRSIVKALSDRETRHPQGPKSFADLSLQGGGLALAGRSLFSLQNQGTWINCVAHEGISLDGLLVDLAWYLANANAVETTVKGRVLRRQIPGYDALVEDASLIDLGPEADPWLGMAAFMPRSANQ